VWGVSARARRAALHHSIVKQPGALRVKPSS
jgi:hypothetical protein